MTSLAPVNEAAFYAGRDDGVLAYIPGEPVGEPVGVDDDYLFGWWCGIGDASAWDEGCAAAEHGLLFCPYQIGSEDECFREMWMSGYLFALSDIEPAGQA
jgi:hypothetical protein